MSRLSRQLLSSQEAKLWGYYQEDMRLVAYQDDCDRSEWRCRFSLDVYDGLVETQINVEERQRLHLWDRRCKEFRYQTTRVAALGTPCQTHFKQSGSGLLNHCLSARPTAVIVPFT